MSTFESLQAQPNFPSEDLTESNAAFADYYLQHERSHEAHEQQLLASMRPLHLVGHQALRFCNVAVDYTEQEYQAFCGGFAALEYVSQLVREKLQDDTLVVANAKSLLLDTGEMVDLEVSQRYKWWLEVQPHTYGVIVESGVQRGETIKQLHARTMGALVARELQLAS